MKKPMAGNPLRVAMNLDNVVEGRVESSQELEDWYRAIDSSQPISTNSILLVSSGVPDHIKADYQEGVLRVSLPSRNAANP